MTLDVGDLSELADRAAVTAIAGDATRSEAVAEAFAAADALGEVDAVVANVGGATVAAAHETSPEEWRRVLDLNLTACVSRDVGRRGADAATQGRLDRRGLLGAGHARVSRARRVRGREGRRDRARPSDGGGLRPLRRPRQRRLSRHDPHGGRPRVARRVFRIRPRASASSGAGPPCGGRGRRRRSPRRSSGSRATSRRTSADTRWSSTADSPSSVSTTPLPSPWLRSERTPALARLVRRPGPHRQHVALPRADAQLRPDARRAPVGPADRRDRADRLRHHAVQPAPSRAREPCPRGDPRRRRDRLRVPDSSDPGDVQAPHGDARPQPPVPLPRRDPLRLPTRRRRAHDRLRQDDAGAADGRRHGRHPGDRPLRRPDAERLARRRAHGLRDDRLEGARADWPWARSTSGSSSSSSPRRRPRPDTATRWAPRRP